MNVKDYKYDYRRSSFKIDGDADNRRYYIKIKSEYVEVSKEVYKICKASYDKIRYIHKVEVAKSVMYYDDIDLATFFICANNEYSITDEIIIKDLYELILNEISKLSEPDRTIAWLVFVEERSISEVSRLINIPRKTVTYRKNNIQKKFQEKIKKCLPL